MNTEHKYRFLSSIINIELGQEMNKLSYDFKSYFSNEKDLKVYLVEEVLSMI